MKVFVLNTNFFAEDLLFERQYEWLKKELIAPTTAQWKVIVYHHPAYSVGIGNHRLSPFHEWKLLQQYYIPLFEQSGVNLVLNGHSHVYERFQKNNILYVTAGPAGGKIGIRGVKNPYSQIIIPKARTVTHFKVNPDEIQMITQQEDGKTIDEVVLTNPKLDPAFSNSALDTGQF